jgi:dimethylamine corrinoid protein
MGVQEMFDRLAEVIEDGSKEKAKELAQEVVAQNIDPIDAIEKGLSRGMNSIGAKFESGEAFLPELLMAAANFNAAMEVLKPVIDAQKRGVTVLETGGFEVIDLGVDNASLHIIEQAEKNQADIIALSSLMTTTMPVQKEVIDMLGQMNLRDRYFVIVGGGPVNQEWSEKIGADGFGISAIQALELAKSLMLKKRS